MADEGFHEIQLGKKQLVFLFMAAAVFSVVVFLIGVWVGRDVKRPQEELTAETAGEITPDLGTTPAPAGQSAPAPTPQPPTQIASNELDYTARLQTGNAKPDEPQKAAEPPTPAAESGDVPKAIETKPAKPDATKSDATKTAPAKPDAAKPDATKGADKTAAAKDAKPGTFNLQVGAFGTKKPADTLVAKLKKKGYEAYIATSASGPTKFKVRVGPYASRAEADAAAEKLKKEEGLSPLVQR